MTTGSWRELLGPKNLGASTVLAGGVALYATNEFLTISLLPSAVADIGGQRFYAWVTTVYLVASVVAATTVSVAAGCGSGRGGHICWGSAVFGAGQPACARWHRPWRCCWWAAWCRARRAGCSPDSATRSSIPLCRSRCGPRPRHWCRRCGASARWSVRRPAACSPNSVRGVGHSVCSSILTAAIAALVPFALPARREADVESMRATDPRVVAAAAGRGRAGGQRRGDPARCGARRRRCWPLGARTGRGVPRTSTVGLPAAVLPPQPFGPAR